MGRPSIWRTGMWSCGGRSSRDWRSIFECRSESSPCAFRPRSIRHAALWRRIAARESLRIADLDALIGLSWQYADVCGRTMPPRPVPSLVSTIKARQLGFGDCIDSEECVVEQLGAMQALGYLPKP